MTKDEMMEKYYPNNNDEANYIEAQKRIKEAMENGEQYVYLPKELPSEFTWWATYETIDRLREDGFAINKVWKPWEYWSVEWYNN